MATKTKGLGYLLAGNIIFRSLNIICTVAVTFILTRLLGTGGYGILSLLVANASIFNLLTCLGAESGITYQYAAGTQHKPILFSIAYVIVLLQLGLLLFAEFIYCLISGHYLFTVTGDISISWGILYFASIVVIDKYQALFNGAHLYTRANKALFIVNLVSLLVFGYCYFGYPLGNDSLYLGIFIFSSVGQAIFMILLFHSSADRKLSFAKPSGSDWKMFFSYSLVVLITNVIQFLAYRVDYWFVDYFHDKEQLGLYSLAVKLGQVLWILPVLMAGIFFPRMAAGGEEEEHVWLKLIRVANAFFLLIAILAALFAPWIIPLFAGETFHPSVVPFIWLLPGLLFFCYNIIFAAYFAGKKMLTVNLRGSILCLLFVLLGDLLLIPGFGIKGAAIASSIAYMIAGVHHLWQFAVLKKMPIFSLLMVNKSDLTAVGNYIRKYTRRA